jgi:hypothetical protein
MERKGSSGREAFIRACKAIRAGPIGIGNGIATPRVAKGIVKLQQGTFTGVPPPAGVEGPPPENCIDALKGAGSGNAIEPLGRLGMVGSGIEKLIGGSDNATVIGLGIETYAVSPGGLNIGKVMPYLNTNEKQGVAVAVVMPILHRH